MRTLIAPTEDFIKIERTVLDSDVSAGSNVSVTLASNDGFDENAYIVVGREGSELAELQQVNAAVTPGTAIQVATLKFNHKKGEPVTVYRYNQRKFYGCATVDGTFVELTSDGSPKDIQVDDPQGTMLEYTDNAYSYFKATYYNETTLEETSIDDADSTDGDSSKRYASIFQIRVAAGMADNPFYADSIVEMKRVQAESEVNASIKARYTLPLSEVPALITNITTMLAAGYIMYEQFGKDGDGVSLLASARSQLKAIREGKLVLLDEDGEELTRQTRTGRLRGYPDGTITSGASDDRKFTIGQEY